MQVKKKLYFSCESLVASQLSQVWSSVLFCLSLSPLIPPCLARYHSDTTPKGYRRFTEGTPKDERSVIVPLWLRTLKRYRALAAKNSEA